MARAYLGGDVALGDDDDDIIGDDEILGDDDEADVARARRAGGVVLRKQHLNAKRRQMLPFSQAFNASQNLVLQLEPQRKFRLERLTFASLTAIYFSLSDVSIAQEPQFVAPGVTLCQLFSEVSQGMSLIGKTANLGAIISLNATNIDTVSARTLWSVVLGTVVMAG